MSSESWEDVAVIGGNDGENIDGGLDPVFFADGGSRCQFK